VECWDVISDLLVVVSVNRQASSLAIWCDHAVPLLPVGVLKRIRPLALPLVLLLPLSGAHEAFPQSRRTGRYYSLVGPAFCASLLSLYTKMKLLLHKLRQRYLRTGVRLQMKSVAAVRERVDAHSKKLQSALMYLLVAACEVLSQPHATPTRLARVLNSRYRIHRTCRSRS
jgi:hypothetical protein